MQRIHARIYTRSFLEVSTSCRDTIDELGLNIDPVYANKIALIHDICEYKMQFDIDSFDIVKGKNTKKYKKELENKTVAGLAEEYGRQDIYDAWIDFEQGNTPEAKYIKALDKIESLLHMIKRGDRGRNQKDGDHMALCADKAVLAFPEVIPLLKEVKKRLRNLFEDEGMEWKPEYNKV